MLPPLGLGIEKSVSFGGLTLNSIFSTYSFTNMWSAEKITEVSGTTTAIDYAGEHNLANIGGEQPTTTASNSDFGGRQTLNFNGGEGLEKSVSDWRSGDSGGMITVVMNHTSSSFPLVASDTATDTSYGGIFNQNTQDFGVFNQSGTKNSINNEAASLLTGYGVSVYTFISTGSAYREFVNGIEQPVNNRQGSNDGDWFDSLTTNGTDNITIGKIERTTTNYGYMDWALSGYHNSVLSDENIIAMHQDFMTYYGITIPLLMSRLDQIGGGIINAWNYTFLNVTGTTTTVFDLKGQYDMSNPAAGNQPTLTASGLSFDGINNYLYNGVSDYLIAKTTGVIHSYLTAPGGDFTLTFTSSDETTNNNTFVCDVDNVDRARVQAIIGGGGSADRSTTTVSGKVLVTAVQDGSDAYLLINGVKVTAYDFDSMGTYWFADINNRDNITMGAVIRSTPAYRASIIHGVILTDYVSEAKAIEEATAILNSGL